MYPHLSFEDGWRVLEQGILTCSKILEGSTNIRPTVSEYMNYYDCVYTMSVQKQDYSEEMYNGYKETLAKCVRAKVLPHLMHKTGDCFLSQLAEMWSNYCIMVKYVAGFFRYLDRGLANHKRLPCLEDTAATSFFSSVFSFFDHEITDALLTLIRQERDGSKVDKDLLMSILRGICRSEVKSRMKNALLQDTHAYFSSKSSEWILQYPLQDYLAKVKDTMEKEIVKLTHYLCISEEESSNFCLQAICSPLMQTYRRYASENKIGGQLLLEIYQAVEDELVAKCNRLTIHDGSDNSSADYMGYKGGHLR